jgi:uncharacterized RDD family membrane protein YckC
MTSQSDRVTPHVPADENGHVDDPALLAIPLQARPFQGKPAGVVSRVLAGVIDLLVTIGMFTGAYLGYSGLVFLWHPAAFSFPSVSRLVILIVGAALLWLYLTVTWTLTGRSYGDRVLGLLVLGRKRSPIGLFLAALRAAFCVGLPIGLLWSAVSRRGASIQDIVLGTSVIYAWERPTKQPWN